MEIVTVWVRYDGDEWDQAPQLAEAWTEFDIENHPDGWDEARDKAINGADVRDHRIIVVDVPYTKITDAFTEWKVLGTVEGLRDA